MKLDASKIVRYRNCAEELRTLAHGDHHTVENRDALVRIAEAYDHMAESLEKLLKQAGAPDHI